MMADSANGGELRLSPQRFGMANMAWTWCVGAWCVVVENVGSGG
ncbi:hypothetical protein F383_25640 [Gossypium arboreum]|uniref:Uncharacterized protein n=1 Tax=Gossypium arboreum TaxID=29729 RepID=A0A0B0NVB6_GOSAR|nr:hypothetical protein F383_25640 [Gossypium arboreum]